MHNYEPNSPKLFITVCKLLSFVNRFTALVSRPTGILWLSMKVGKGFLIYTIHIGRHFGSESLSIISCSQSFSKIPKSPPVISQKSIKIQVIAPQITEIIKVEKLVTPHITCNFHHEQYLVYHQSHSNITKYHQLAKCCEISPVHKYHKVLLTQKYHEISQTHKYHEISQT